MSSWPVLTCSFHRDVRGGELRPGEGVPDEGRPTPLHVLAGLYQHDPGGARVRQRQQHLPGRVCPAAGPVPGPAGPGGHVPGRV